jgi:EAL and modified HD-GYP domain-containing signal transduction protein
MVALAPAQFPLVTIRAVANAQNGWVALTLQVAPAAGDETGALHALFDQPDLLAAFAPLDCVLLVSAPAILTPAVLELMPPNRVVFAISAAVLTDQTAVKQILNLHDEGYRILLDGQAPSGVPVPPTLRSVCLDCTDAAPKPGSLLALFGPHLARCVDSGVRFIECKKAGFEWYSGDYPMHPAPSAESGDGTSRKRLLTLLGLLVRDAESHELEVQLKQDPALSYHLLKLVNSAAFALSTPITSFGQAINLLGRRQLQRWLQLLLYARQQEDGLANPLLPLAAVRAAQMEAVCKLQGGDRDAQDIAFMTGVFSLLDVLFAMPMAEIVGALNLATDAAQALLKREGPLGRLLSMVETAAPDLLVLQGAGIEPLQWWQSQLRAYHWAIQVSRNL